MSTKFPCNGTKQQRLEGSDNLWCCLGGIKKVSSSVYHDGWDMALPLPSVIKLAVSWENSRSWMPSKATKGSRSARYDQRFWNAHDIIFIDYLEIGGNNHKRMLHKLIGPIKGWKSTKMTPYGEEGNALRSLRSEVDGYVKMSIFRSRKASKR